MKFNCDNCGKIDEALLDGYMFGDRTLEGVMFKVKKNDEGKCEVESVKKWETNPYLAGLNKKYWIKIAQECAEQYDIFECPKCHQEVVPDNML